MQITKKFGMGLCVLLLIIASISSFNGCTKQSPTTVDLSTRPELNVLTFREGTAALNKVVPVSQWVTQKDGGELILNYERDKDDDFGLRISLKVLPGTISQDAELTLSMDDKRLDLTFAPHGIIFSEPALLNIEATNLNLSGVPDQVNVYYDNPVTEQWEMMDSYDVVVGQDQGYVKIVDTEIPHFSRYAIGWGEVLGR